MPKYGGSGEECFFFSVLHLWCLKLNFTVKHINGLIHDVFINLEIQFMMSAIKMLLSLKSYLLCSKYWDSICIKGSVTFGGRGAGYIQQNKLNILLLQMKNNVTSCF